MDVIKDEGFAGLVQLARKINPSLPDDLSHSVITITASRYGMSATANPIAIVLRDTEIDRSIRDRIHKRC